MKRWILASLLLASPAFAHHGWNEYDAEKPLELSGTITQSGYVHPHGFIRLSTSDKQWNIVLAPPTRMSNRGLTEDMLKTGIQVSVYGYPHRQDTQELRAERITVADKTVELR